MGRGIKGKEEGESGKGKEDRKRGGEGSTWIFVQGPSS